MFLLKGGFRMKKYSWFEFWQCWDRILAEAIRGDIDRRRRPGDLGGLAFGNDGVYLIERSSDL